MPPPLPLRVAARPLVAIGSVPLAEAADARSRPGARPSGFTLIELLTVMAVVAILAGLLFPALGSARRSALKSQTRVQFTQWAAALEEFHQEYGYYPGIGTEGKLATSEDTLRFVRTLSGRNPDGSAVAQAADLNGNFKRLPFCRFSSTDFFDPDRPGGAPDYSGNEVIRDAFGNIEIGVMIDRNGDGFIKPADDGPLAVVHTANGGIGVTPDESVLPAAGIRAGVLFYSAGSGTSPDDMLMSWK